MVALSNPLAAITLCLQNPYTKSLNRPLGAHPILLDSPPNSEPTTEFQFMFGLQPKCSCVRILTLAALLILPCLVAYGQQGRPQTPPRVANIRPLNTAPRQPVAPFPPLDRKHQEYLDKVLQYWAHSSSKIKRYQCSFNRWQYDPVFGPGPDAKGVVPAKTIAKGVVRYQSPDKAMYEVTKLYDYAPPKQRGDQPQYAERKDNALEKWICDGKSVFDYDFATKRVIERELPPNMQGKAIADGPLPFLFGVTAEKLNARYWIRIVTPPNAKSEYWLEAWPKQRADAANFQKVRVILAEEDFLPKGIEIYATNFNPRTNPARTAFTFDDRKVIPQINLNPFLKKFHRPQLPTKEWKFETIKHQAPHPGNPAKQKR